VTVLWLIPAVLLGAGVGGYTERYRWVSWARRNHPEQAEAERLTWL
jgi:hypothetical protein